MALYFVPYAYLTVASSLRNIDPAMEEASYLNGASVLRTALRVTLPVIRPALLSAFFFIFVLSAGTFAIPAVLDRGSQVRFLAVDVFQASATYPIDYGTIGGDRHAAVLDLPRRHRLLPPRVARRAAVRDGDRARLPHPAGAAARTGASSPSALVLAYVTLSIVLPYLALIYSAFTRFTSASILHAPWTLRNAIEVAFVAGGGRLDRATRCWSA